MEEKYTPKDLRRVMSLKKTYKLRTLKCVSNFFVSILAIMLLFIFGDRIIVDKLAVFFSCILLIWILLYILHCINQFTINLKEYIYLFKLVKEIERALGID